MRVIFLKFSAILLFGFIIEWWITWYSSLTFLQGTIPHTPMKISGLLLGILMIGVLIVALRAVLNLNPELSVLKLTVFGMAICLVAEIIFQTIRQPFLTANSISDRLYYYLLGTIGVSVFAAAFAFFISFQLKTKNTKLLVIMIAVFLVIISIIKKLLSTGN